MNDVAKYPGLMRRSARWYVRLRVPKDLAGFVGRSEIWRSLRTGDHREAVRRYTSARAEIWRWLDRQRARRDTGERLNGEAPRLVASWFHDHERRAADLDFGLVGEDLTEALGETEGLLADLLAGAAGEDVAAAVDQVLLTNDWPPTSYAVGSISTRRVRIADAPDQHRTVLAELVRRALVEAARRRRERLQGSPNGVSFDPLFTGSLNGVTVPPSGAQALRTVANGADRHGNADGGLTVGELIAQFEAERVARVGFSKRVEYNLLLKAVRELWDDHRPARSITRQDCRVVRDLFSTLPPNSTKRFPKLTLAKAAEHAKAEGLAPLNPSTANGYMARLSTLMKWATKERFIDANPAESLQVAAPEGDPRDARLPFGMDQLKAIFSAPPYVPRDLKEGATFWAPLISLFGGLRLSEITGLGTADVVERGGVHVLLVRRGKTRAAKQVIPVHDELIRTGFLRYVARRRKASEDFLFELERDRRGYRTNAIQKALGRQIEAAGAKAPRTSFHSLRHNFRDALREADVSRDAVLALGGWSAGGTEEDYGSGLRAQSLAREIAKVRYDDLDLSDLHVR